jgi:hypothetical protein
MYIDASLDKECDATGNLMRVSTSHLYLGRTSPSESSAESYIGLLDDVRLYYRALTASEISTLYRENGY